MSNLSTYPFDYPWSPDAGDGTYRNPILHADYSDPDVIRVGDDFFMVASSFNCTPGLPVLHSTDLVNWRLINHAIRNIPHNRYMEVKAGCGIWAPAIRYHAGQFWIFFPLPDEGIYVTTAEEPAGIWREPWCLQEAQGWIDPCPFWDDDGNAYLVHAYAASRAGIKERIHVRPMSPDGRRILGEGQEVIHAPRHPYLEGPKVHKLNGWYYILAPGGGVATGWQVAFRSRHIYGPYEEKIVLEQGSTLINGPHQGALIDLANGDWWFMHFQDAGAYGRIVHLQPVSWEKDWPLMGVDFDGNGIGEPVASCGKPRINSPSQTSISRHIPQSCDEFDCSALGLQWQWHANHDAAWVSLDQRKGWLRVMSRPFPIGGLGLAPEFLSQKFPARTFVVETLLDFSSGNLGEIAGIGVVGGGEFAALCLRRMVSGDELIYWNREGMKLIGLSETPWLRLKLTVFADATCHFSVPSLETTGFALALPRVFKAGAGGWIGAKVGLFSFNQESEEETGYADFDYFRFSGLAG